MCLGMWTEKTEVVIVLHTVNERLILPFMESNLIVNRKRKKDFHIQTSLVN